MSPARESSISADPMIKKIARAHPEALLIGLVVVFFVIIVGFYFWGVNTIVTTVNQALNYTPPQSSVGFDLRGASQLDYRGLASTSTATQ